jgi:hypothetical protein
LEIGGKIKISHFRFGDSILSMKYVWQPHINSLTYYV